MAKKLTQKEFEEKVRKLYPDGEYVVLGKYVNTLTPVLIRHAPCGREYNIIPHSFLQKRTCIDCSYRANADLRRKTKHQLQQDIDNIHGIGEYILVGDYVNAHTKTEFFHKQCNKIITMSPNTLVKGCGCVECSRIENGIKRRKSHEDYVNKVKLVNPNITILGTYVKLKEHIDVKCNICGHQWNPYADNLINSASPSGCPLCKISHGEMAIANYLNSKNIRFEHEKRFDDLFGTGGGKLSYDFYIEDYNLLIEYSGKQHYEPIDYWGGKEYFIIQQEHDRLKKEYSFKNNYNFLEIPYWDFDKIEEILDKELGNLIEVA